jgi:hypothetical protein
VRISGLGRERNFNNRLFGSPSLKHKKEKISGPRGKNLIVVRHEVAKQTRSRDHKRYVPLEPEAAEILRPLAQEGPVITCCDNHLYIKRRELAHDMRIKLPENCLRNSYATYALTFRSIGEVAKAMGDAESTVKRFYVQTLEPGVGHEWFQTKL